MSDISFQCSGAAGIICFDREPKLHALTPDMVLKFEKHLDLWKEDPKIRHILLCAKGSRAFCAGADIRFFYESKNPQKNSQFCIDEYRVNQKLFHYPKPCIALIDGLVMGGGVGLSQYGKYRIATENYQFAMPEVHIGFFPDVAISYLFTKMPCCIGWYLALTGSRINRKRAAQLGLITHAIAAEEKELWINRIAETQDVEELLQEIAVESAFIPTSEDFEIEHHFSQESLEKIFESLALSETNFAKNTLTLLQKLSPLSLLITFEALKRSCFMTFDEVIAMDGHIASTFMRGKDIYEGIRAKIIDKDGSPHWSYPCLKSVPSSALIPFFSS